MLPTDAPQLLWPRTFGDVFRIQDVAQVHGPEDFVFRPTPAPEVESKIGTEQSIKFVLIALQLEARKPIQILVQELSQRIWIPMPVWHD